jgi:hypothetical protein
MTRLFRKYGAPIPMPSRFASSEREMTHPSLFDSTTTGRPSSRGANTRSHET